MLKHCSDYSCADLYKRQEACLMVEIVCLCTNTAESELLLSEVKALLEITVCFEIASFLEPL